MLENTACSVLSWRDTCSNICNLVTPRCPPETTQCPAASAGTSVEGPPAIPDVAPDSRVPEWVASLRKSPSHPRSRLGLISGVASRPGIFQGGDWAETMLSPLRPVQHRPLR